ncbi:hypothetical protein OF83DRAFT_1180592 [Amylostereum chailletii]|nr:hypothetical protein OF83DRAFT_1180592 [Amylostereum chailletii]
MDKISESGPINEKPAMPPTQDSVKYGVLTDISASMNPPPSAHRISFVHGSEPSVDSTSSSTSTLAVGNPDVEKALPWADYDKDELPPKTQGHIFRNFRHQIFTLYRRLFGVVFLANVGIFIWTIVRGNIRTDHVGLVVVANLFCAILMRQDHVINAFFTAFSSVPQSWPLWFRRFCARVYHIGGLHSGCAVAGFMWLILFTVQATREVLTGGPASIPVVVLTYWILCLLGVILLLAYPRFRTMFHNQFETTHRFLGWTSTASVWALFVILINDYRESKQTLGQAAIRSPSFWLILVMSLSIVLPWVRLRKVPVRAVVLSNHAVRLHFDYGVTPVAGSFTRISDKPLTEWHSFATVPVPEKSGYSVVVSRAGDWTSKQIDNPPTELWSW